ncbi:zf-HC2 domain-containing protein [Salipaludibacillus aurantiacus]|uniref:Anti-sigma-W factor RsiW n=1 Tax=Salipaludibacillus aurantiacus TaxID=1601833 RepID=A0A1H9V298_9BACI|nr:zf-HC2 domain-containing protein [Salipaludibacillus aurantiacus]SES15856.1 Transmembrane transcriptional regulator (anti-sigma factor RsiW) [Salipaludibacillus aurantiacus]
MACSQENQKHIYKYLDEEMTLLEKKQFEAHIMKCDECHAQLRELRKTVAIIQSASHFEAPKGFTDNVMKQLPKQSKSQTWKNFMRKHPFILAAATFFLIFAVSLSAAFSDDDKEIVVKGEGQFIVDETRGVVIIPEGESISGDLIVRNGDIEIAGEVTGNITVINGEYLLASAEQVSGEIEEINQFMDWLWFQTKSFFSEVVNFADDSESDNHSD